MDPNHPAFQPRIITDRRKRPHADRIEDAFQFRMGRFLAIIDAACAHRDDPYLRAIADMTPFPIAEGYVLIDSVRYAVTVLTWLIPDIIEADLVDLVMRGTMRLAPLAEVRPMVRAVSDVRPKRRSRRFIPRGAVVVPALTYAAPTPAAPPDPADERTDREKAAEVAAGTFVPRDDTPEEVAHAVAHVRGDEYDRANPSIPIHPGAVDLETMRDVPPPAPVSPPMTPEEAKARLDALFASLAAPAPT